MKNIIKVNGINVYAFHGCLDEEAKIGGHYTVDVEMETDYSTTFETDDLNHTIDYCQVYDIVKQEMAIRSKLIEHVANRIAMRMKAEIPQELKHFMVRIIKHNPPMNGQVDNVSVEIVM